MNRSSTESFLYQLAEHIINKHGNDLSKLCFVFPSRRAGVFFLNSLSHIISTPIFSPRITTIQQFSQQLVGLKGSDMLTLSVLLYAEIKKQDYFNLYSEENTPPKPELLIEQCQKLLSDFNDIDNYLADADKVFSNIHNLSELTSLDYLTDEQRTTILEFWNVTLPERKNTLQAVLPKESNYRSKFESFFSQIKNIYPLYKQILKEKGIGYEGMIAREAANLTPLVIEQRITELYPNSQYLYFAGLYALTPAETKLLKAFLHPQIKHLSTHFVWENFNINSNLFPNKTTLFSEIFRIINENQKEFPGITIDTFSSNEAPQFNVLEASSLIAGRKIIPSIIERITKTYDSKAIQQLQTAIIVPDEKGLPALLSSLNAIDAPLNVTMGYPLSQTNIAIWLSLYFDFVLSFRVDNKQEFVSSEQFHKLIHHPLTELLLSVNEVDQLKEKRVYSIPFRTPKDFLELQDDEEPSIPLKDLVDIPQKPSELLIKLIHFIDLLAIEIADLAEKSDENSRDKYYIDLEFLSYYKLTIQSLQTVLPSIEADLNLSTTIVLLSSLANSVNVPFEGEPLEGLQVMGILESRLLKFDYLIIPDANEKQLPKAYSQDNSFIPLNLRLGYKLPTYRNKEAIDTYYLYRLILSAKKVWFITGGVNDVEPSRFIMQLEYILQQPLNRFPVSLPSTVYSPQEITIEKTAQVISKLNEFLLPERSKTLSPSSLNTYSICPLRFYLNKVENIQENLIEDDLLTPIDLGNVIHQSMEKLYTTNKLGIVLNHNDINYIIAQSEQVVKDMYISNVFHNSTNNNVELQGIHKIYFDTALKYVQTILLHDRDCYKQLKIIACEQKVQFEVNLPNLNKTVLIKGIIDRIDSYWDEEKNKQVIRLVDYKTGNDEKYFKDWIEIFPSIKDQEEKAVVANKAIAQLMLYCLYWVENTQMSENEVIMPTLYILREMQKVNSSNNNEEYDASLWQKKGRNCESLQLAFTAESPEIQLFKKEHLIPLLEEIFNVNTPFTQTKTPFLSCRFCQFASLCKKQS